MYLLHVGQMAFRCGPEVLQSAITSLLQWWQWISAWTGLSLGAYFLNRASRFLRVIGLLLAKNAPHH